MKHILLTSCLFVALVVAAQEEKSGTILKKTNGGWYNLTQMSFIIGEENASSAAKSNMLPSVVMINGIRANDHFSIGLGVGMTSFSYITFPVFADVRFAFLKGDLSPVLALKGGYSIAKNKKEIFPNQYYGAYKNTGGGMCNPELGFKVKMTERVDFLLTIGYYYQHLKSEINSNPGESYAMKHERVTDINRLSFTIGFLFK